MEREDGAFEVPVDDEVAMTIAAARLPGQTDDDVVSLVKAEIAAQRGRSKTPKLKASLKELRYWRSSLRHALQTLKGLEGS